MHCCSSGPGSGGAIAAGRVLVEVIAARFVVSVVSVAAAAVVVVGCW